MIDEITFEHKHNLFKKLKENIDPSLELHVHDDIDYLFKNTTIPYAFKLNAEVYIMQESRIVFIGTRKFAMLKIIRDRGKYLKSCFPEISLLDGTPLS